MALLEALRAVRRGRGAGSVAPGFSRGCRDGQVVERRIAAQEVRGTVSDAVTRRDQVFADHRVANRWFRGEIDSGQMFDNSGRSPRLLDEGTN